MAKNSMIPVDIRQKIIKAREEGKSFASIGKAYGYTESGIYRFIKHYKETGRIEPKEHSRKAAVTQEKIDIIQEIIDENPGITLKGIKDKSGLELSTHRISYIIKNYTKNGRIACMPLTREIHQKIQTCFNNGMKLAEIAKSCNCGTNAVARVLELYRKKGDVGYRYERISAKVRDRVARDRNLGMSRKDIASKYGLKIKTVDYILEPYIDEGKVEKQNCQKMPLETQAMIAEGYNKGLTRKELMVISGYCRDTVSKTLKHLNKTGKIKFRKPRKEITTEVKEKIIRDRSRGFTIREVSDTYGVALSTVHTIFRNRNK